MTIHFTRIDNSTSGVPRYVCDFPNLLTKGENGYHDPITDTYIEPTVKGTLQYDVAVKRANLIGGKKYNTKKYSGGIVFESYNIRATGEEILLLTSGK